MDYLRTPRFLILRTVFLQISTALLHLSSKVRQLWLLAALSLQDDSWTSALNKWSLEWIMHSGAQAEQKLWVCSVPYLTQGTSVIDHEPESLFDLLELYTHHRSQTTVGSEFPADRFLTVRIPLNQEASEQHIPRYDPWIDRPHKQANGTGTKPQDAQRSAHPLTPIAANGDRQRTGERGRDAAVRFMLDPACADEERRQVAAYFKVEMEEYEVEG